MEWLRNYLNCYVNIGWIPVSNMTFIRFVDHGKVIYNVWCFQKKKKKYK